jgi:hypothetical protein
VSLVHESSLAPINIDYKLSSAFVLFPASIYSYSISVASGAMLDE